MSNGPISPRIDDLAARVDRVGLTLLDLDADPDRRLVGEAELTGISLTSWQAAKADLDRLWSCYRALTDVVEQARSLAASRGARTKADELERLLDGRSVRVVGEPVDVLERKLLDTDVVVTQLTPDEALGEMANAFDRVRSTITKISTAWSESIPAVQGLRASLDGADADAASVGADTRPATDALRARLDAFAAAVFADPLGTGSKPLTELAGLIDAEVIRWQRGAAIRLDAPGELATLAREGDALARLVADTQAAQRHLRSRVVVPEEFPACADIAAVDADLARLRALVAGERWADVARLIGDVRSRLTAATAATQRQAATANELLSRRSELRARLDLYRELAVGRGLAEDRALHEAHEAAAECLYTAPCDLDVADELVQQYGAAVAGARAQAPS